MKTLLIAEAGVNHNGDIRLAKKLIDVAAEANFDYVKFQTFKTKAVIAVNAPKADYQKEATSEVESQYEMALKLEFDKSKHLKLIQYCKGKKIKFLSTAFDLDSIDLLEELEIDLFKVPSGELTNLPYLRKIAGLNKPVILSTGMANLKEIELALEVLMSKGLTKEDITVLHCNTEYPTAMSDVNLLAMNTIAKACNVKIGYSDHTLGIEIPTAAVALGATVIEKHFTLDRNLPGPDHAASLEPDELKAMAKAIRNIELAISGTAKKEPSASETKNIAIARKSIHIKHYLKKGSLITEEDLIALRPGIGISPMEWDNVVGKKANIDLAENHLLNYSDIS